MFHIGTSGYSYVHWKKIIKNLNDYSKYLNSVEINNTFYKFPSTNISKKWSKLVDPNFTFTIKINQIFTHFYQLNFDNQKRIKQLKSFFDNLIPIKSQIVCYLFQFNNKFKYNQKNIEKIIYLKSILDKLIKYSEKSNSEKSNFSKNRLAFAFEFRNLDWYVQENADLFNKLDFSLVFWNHGRIETPIFNQKNMYFRLHGTEQNNYCGKYDIQYKKKLVKTIKKFKPQNAFVYFNNVDCQYDGLKDAIEMNKLVNL